jgi:hypothetical protein
MTTSSSSPPGDQPFFFAGFHFPSYTPVPDQVFDELLTVLSGAELKALLYICRRTFGFKKESDNISLNQLLHGLSKKDGTQLDAGTGLSKPTLLKALRELQDKGIIESTRRMSDEHGCEATNYRLRFTNEPNSPANQPVQHPEEGRSKNFTTPGQKTLPGGGKKTLPGGGKISLPPPWSKNFTTQETVVQQTVLQETVRQQTDLVGYDRNNNNSDSSTSPSLVVVASSPSALQSACQFPTSLSATTPPSAPQTSLVTEPPIPLDPPSPTVANQSAEQALLAIGIGHKIAKRLASQYQAESILEKLDYLAFLQAERPHTVQNPRGWLRSAIEQDYGPPDGFLTAAERQRRNAEAAEQAQRVEALAQQQRTLAAQQQAEQTARRRSLRERYGASAADEQLWQAVCSEVQASYPHLHTLLTQATMLACTHETVQLGFESELWMNQLAHPGTLVALKRTLKALAKRPLEVETVLLPPEMRDHSAPSP